MTLDQLLQSQFGVKTFPNVNPVTGTCLTTVTKVLTLNPNRVGLVFMNMGANDIYVSPNNDVTVGNGILLQANGGGVTLSWNEDFNLVASDWFGIANGANSNIYVMEVISY